MTEAMVVVMVVGVVVSIPLFGLTLRFAVKPVVERTSASGKFTRPMRPTWID